MSELIEEHVAQLRAAGHSEKTIEARVYAIKRLDAALPYGALFAATEQIQGWFASLRRKGRTKATLFIYDHHSRAFFDWACRAGYLDGNPMAEMARPRKPKCIPRPVTEDDARGALECTGMWRIVGLLAIYQGMRASEIAACWREHITEQATYIPLAKGGEPASVPTHPLVWAEIQPMPAGPLIVNRYGREVDGQWLSSASRRYYPRAGLPTVRLHRLRHLYATMLLEKGVDLRVIQELMRHANISSTVGYTKVTDQRRSAAIRLLPDLTGHGPADDGPVLDSE